MSLDFKIAIQDGIAVVSFKGKILTDSHLELLNTEIGTKTLEKTTNWIFDFDQLTHINSSGINFIIRSLTRSRINCGDLVLCSVKGNVKTLFEIGKINEIFSIYSSTSDAINHFKQ